MIKHIFCDLDGTLYRNRGISDEDLEAIKNLEEDNIVFNIATGRTLTQSVNLTKDCVDMQGYYINENGSYIYDSNHNQIFKGTISDEIVKKVISRFNSDKAIIYFKYKGEIIVQEEIKEFNIYNIEYKIHEDFSQWESFNNDIGNIGIASMDIEELNRIELYMKSEFSEILDIYFSAEYVLNFVPKGVSKRSSIEKVCEILGINMDEIATIGDSPNDINMLEGIKYSFAMENARESVKNSANYSAESVADAIKQIKEINAKLKN